MRNFSAAVPLTRSQVHLTSLAVNGLPSCHLMPGRSLKVSSLPSSLHDQLEARSGTIEFRLFCGTCWSNITRLLNTPIIGPSVAIVDSSWIDMLAGLVPIGTRRTPPDFSAEAGAAARVAASNTAARSAARKTRVNSLPPRLLRTGCELFVEPDVLHPVAVVDAIDHGHEPLDVGLRAGPAARIEDDRSGLLLGQPSFDLPHQLL